MDEPAGFGEFVQARRAALLRSAWMLTGDYQAAEDLLQTSLARTWPAWRRLSPDGNPEGYVRRVMFRTYVSWWRRRWRGEVPTAVLPDPAEVGDVHAAAELRLELSGALRSLPRGQRAVVVLRYYEDLSEAETATLLGCSVGTVKSQTHKALAKLRCALPHLAERQEAS